MILVHVLVLHAFMRHLIIRVFSALSKFALTLLFTVFSIKAPIARVSADEWNSFLEFSKDFSSGSLDSWEDDGAWPSLLDDFVDFARK